MRSQDQRWQLALESTLVRAEPRDSSELANKTSRADMDRIYADTGSVTRLRN